MSEPLRYATGRDLFAAVKAKAADQARRHAQQPQHVIRQFIYDRLLARLFHDPNPPWLLKGGNALMSREPLAARASLDLDIAAHQAEEDLDELLRRFAAATEMDLGDHFRFEIISRREHHQGNVQPHVAGYQLTLATYCGIRNLDTVKIDVVAGTLVTGTPQPLTRPSLAIDGLTPVVVIVYPIADHVADKVCATAETHGSFHTPSTRVRDLVDLVVIANTQPVDAGDLARAISLEWAYRGLPGTPTFDPPTDWASSYARLAQGTPGCASHLTFDAAVRLVREEFLRPVLIGHTIRGSWEPSQHAWR